MASWSSWFLMLAVVCGAVGVIAAKETSSVKGYIFAGLTLTCSCIFLHIWSLRPAANISLMGLVRGYVELNLFGKVGSLILMRFNFICQDVQKAQTKTLLRFLRVGETTEYGRDHNIAEINSVENFRSHMPLTTYEDYKPYVERCLSGEKNIFFKEKVTFFGATSGTTSGKSKFYPINMTENFLWLFPSFMMCFASLLSQLPKIKQLKFLHNVWIPSKFLKTEHGVEKGSVSTKMLQYQPNCCSPRESYSIYDEKAGQYVHMLFALREPEVGTFMTLTSSVLLMLLSMVEQNWERFVHDIRRGEINRDLDIPEDIRTSLNNHLTPSPERADELEAIFRSGCRGMVPRIWPHLSGISTICTGTFALQGRVAQDLYIGKDIPMYAYLHMSTEAMYGALLYDDGLRNKDTGEVRDDYVIIPNVNFYEFIPVEKVEEKQPDCLLAHQVEVGRDYEMVVTTHRGLYRFRTGDLIRVVGFRGNTPKYRVLQRVGYVLNVHVEKVPEVVFCEAVERAAGQWTSGKLVNFAASENIHVDKLNDTKNDQLFYVIFLATDSSQLLLEKEKSLVDTELCRVSDTYRAYRNKGSISPALVLQVHNDAFQQIRAMASERNPLLYRFQYKHPRIVRHPDSLKTLINNQI